MPEFLITDNPKTPKTGRKKLFPKSDGSWYEKANDGTVKTIGIRMVSTRPASANAEGQVGDIYSDTEGTFFCVAPSTWIKFATEAFEGDTDLVTYISDNQFFIEGTTFKVGFSLIYGGCISYFGLKTGGKNYVNSHDTGRYNGVSFYSQPEPYTVVGGVASAFYENTGWNPVQGGDAGNNPSPVQTYSWDASTNTFYIKTIPLQWKFTNEILETTVTIESYYTFMDSDNTLKCRYVTTVNRGSGVYYASQWSETPYSYWTRELTTIKSYTGATPWVGGAVTTQTYDYPYDGIPNRVSLFKTLESWLHISEAGGDGIGVFFPAYLGTDWWGVTQQAELVDGQEYNSNPCMIVQPLYLYNDTGNYVDEKEIYFMLGSPAEIRAFAVANH